jgi:hypothetical protein
MLINRHGYSYEINGEVSDARRAGLQKKVLITNTNNDLSNS